MRAQVRGMHSPDVDDLDAFTPDDVYDIDVFIQILAGPADSQGEESFNVQVVTPKAVAKSVAANGPLVSRHHLIVAEWDWPKIREFLTNSFEREQAPTWQELAQRLGRIGHWEFEDYRPPSDEPPG